MSRRHCGAVAGGVVLMLLAAQAAVAQDWLERVAEAQGGARYAAGKFTVVVLAGSYREMGRQYGALMKDDLARFYDLAITRTYGQEHHLSQAAMRELSMSVHELYPKRFKEIVEGMAETSGLAVELTFPPLLHHGHGS